jgi:RimJ/RimL family protein N-acetyltransferase
MLTGRLVLLRHLKEEDREAFQAWINERDLVILNGTYHPISDISHREWFESISRRPDTVIFSIVDTQSDRLIGSCYLASIHHTHRTAELQIRIGCSDYRGRGYGTEAVKLLLKHGFHDLNLNRIYLHVFEDNIAAIKTYEKCNFQEEGTLRKAVFVNGKYKNVKMLSILKDEFIE